MRVASVMQQPRAFPLAIGLEVRAAEQAQIQITQAAGQIVVALVGDG